MFNKHCLLSCRNSSGKHLQLGIHRKGVIASKCTISMKFYPCPHRFTQNKNKQKIEQNIRPHFSIIKYLANYTQKTIRIWWFARTVQITPCQFRKEKKEKLRGEEKIISARKKGQSNGKHQIKCVCPANRSTVVVWMRDGKRATRIECDELTKQMLCLFGYADAIGLLSSQMNWHIFPKWESRHW